MKIARNVVGLVMLLMLASACQQAESTEPPFPILDEGDAFVLGEAFDITYDEDTLSYEVEARSALGIPDLVSGMYGEKLAPYGWEFVGSDFTGIRDDPLRLFFTNADGETLLIDVTVADRVEFTPIFAFTLERNPAEQK